MLAPGPSGALKLDTGEETFDSLPRLAETYGDLVRVTCPERRHPQYLLCHPRLIRQVLVNNHKNYVKGVGFERVEMLLGTGIIVSDGAHWRRQRTMIQPAFGRKHMARYFEMIRQVTLELATDWGRRAGQPGSLDVTRAMSEYALEVILRAIFSEDFEALIASAGENPFAFLTDDMTRDLTVAMKFRQLLSRVQALIDERRSSGRRPFDLLSMMLDARASRTGEPMSDRELRDEVATMIIAGHETSAGTLNFAWRLLGEHPEMAEHLVAEATRVSPDGMLNWEQLAELEFTRQVILETLRLYPPVWLFTRRALGEDRLGPYRIEAGAHLFLSPWLIQRSPRFWDAPEDFVPERFSETGLARQEPDAFFPFSAGPRRCIGEFFSLVEMQTHLAILCPRFRLLPETPGPVSLDPGINLRSRDHLRFRIQRRAEANDLRNHPGIDDGDDHPQESAPTL
jgi:cytochrome P450